jgi:hypothetical protein
MATAVSLIFDPGGTPVNHIVAKGLATRITIEPRAVLRKVTQFFGVDAESHIFGGRGGRPILVQVQLYDTANIDFDTPLKLSTYVDNTLNGTAVGKTGQLTITSESNHPPLDDVTYSGAMLLEGPKPDLVGSLGGGYWADVVLIFRQMS